MTFNISGNKKVQRLLKNVADGLYSADTESLRKEIESMHMQRMVRRLPIGRILMNPGLARAKLVRAFDQNQSFRSRISEIKTTCMNKRLALESATDLLHGFLRNRYSQELKRRYSTIGERDNAINIPLQPAKRQITQLYNIELFAEEVIDDIDKAAWSLKEIKETLVKSGKNEGFL